MTEDLKRITSQIHRTLSGTNALCKKMTDLQCDLQSANERGLLHNMSEKGPAYESTELYSCLETSGFLLLSVSKTSSRASDSDT